MNRNTHIVKLRTNIHMHTNTHTYKHTHTQTCRNIYCEITFCLIWAGVPVGDAAHFPGAFAHNTCVRIFICSIKLTNENEQKTESIFH